MRIVLSVIGAVLVCGQAAADAIDLSLNGDAFRVQYLRELRANNLNLDVGWLHNSDNGDVAHIGLHLADLASEGSNPVRAGLGGRIVYTNGDLSNQSGFAVPLGGYVHYSLRRFNRIFFMGEAYFAPSVLSIGDMDRYEEYSARVGYNMMREADIYIGARYVKGEYDDASDARYDTGMNIGFTLRF